MAGSVNKVILVGNLGRDPEVRRLNNGEPVVNLRIATSETWKDKASGERKEKTEWHSVIFNENLARVAEQYLKKGSKVYVEGQLQTRKWQDQQGQEKYTTEVVLQRFRGELTILDSRGGGGASEFGDEEPGSEAAATSAEAPPWSGGPSPRVQARATTTSTTISPSSASGAKVAGRDVFQSHRHRIRAHEARIFRVWPCQASADVLRCISRERWARSACRSLRAFSCNSPRVAGHHPRLARRSPPSPSGAGLAR